MIESGIVRELVEQVLDGSESYLVDVIVKPGNFIVVEIDNDEGVDIAECVLISRFIEENLDREAEDYELEVGSAGVTSPLKTVRQFQKNIGNKMEILTRKGVKFTGILTGADEDGFEVSVTKMVKQEGAKRKVEVTETTKYNYDDVKYVKYSFIKPLFLLKNTHYTEKF